MAIKLRVISDHYRELGEQRSRVFGVNGGTIGRAPDNDWVLPDPKRMVSGHHCEIEYRGGAFWLRDTSTNGVFVNGSDEPISSSGPLVLRDGDRLRLGEYELIVSVDARIDFLPRASDEHSAVKHMGRDIGSSLDLDSLLSPRDPDESGSISVRNAFGLKLPKYQGSLPDAMPPALDSTPPPDPPSPRRGAGPEAPRAAKPAHPTTPAPAPAAEKSVPDWAMKTRAITRQELADAMARRQGRIDARQQTQPFHQQASSWKDLKSATQAFCRGAGIDPSTLSAEALSMLPLVAGQLLRETIVGLNDLAHSRAKSSPGSVSPQSPGSNPLRASTSVEQALVRLFESHARLYGGPVSALREVLQEAKEHELAVQAAMRAGLEAVVGQLAPINVADQFEQGRARALPPGEDPRPRYWEHYADFHRVITQSLTDDELPHSFVEAFSRTYAQIRDELQAKRRERDDDSR
jgi:type VI secretion system protein